MHVAPKLVLEPTVWELFLLWLHFLHDPCLPDFCVVVHVK